MKLIGFCFFFLIDVVTIFHHLQLKGSTVHYNFSHREQERTPFIKNNRSQGLTLTPKIFVTRGSHVITQYICLTDQAWGQDSWILVESISPSYLLKQPIRIQDLLHITQRHCSEVYSGYSVKKIWCFLSQSLNPFSRTIPG